MYGIKTKHQHSSIESINNKHQHSCMDEINAKQLQHSCISSLYMTYNTGWLEQWIICCHCPFIFVVITLSFTYCNARCLITNLKQCLGTSAFNKLGYFHFIVTVISLSLLLSFHSHLSLVISVPFSFRSFSSPFYCHLIFLTHCIVTNDHLIIVTRLMVNCRHFFNPRYFGTLPSLGKSASRSVRLLAQALR